MGYVDFLFGHGPELLGKYFSFLSVLGLSYQDNKFFSQFFFPSFDPGILNIFGNKLVMGVDFINLHSGGRRNFDVAQINPQSNTDHRFPDKIAMKKCIFLPELKRLAAQYKKREGEYNKVLYKDGVGFSHWLVFLKELYKFF